MSLHGDINHIVLQAMRRFNNYFSAGSVAMENLPSSMDALTVWRRYNGRADLKNRIKELGG